MLQSPSIKLKNIHCHLQPSAYFNLKCFNEKKNKNKIIWNCCNGTIFYIYSGIQYNNNVVVLLFAVTKNMPDYVCCSICCYFGFFFLYFSFELFAYGTKPTTTLEIVRIYVFSFFIFMTPTIVEHRTACGGFSTPITVGKTKKKNLDYALLRMFGFLYC